MAEEFQNRFKHTFPKKISSQDVSFQYDIIPVQNAKDTRTPYVDGEILNFVISRNSNEWVDMRACRLEFDLALYQETTETVLNTDMNSYYTFSEGPPFQTCCETVNESTIIYNYNNEFSRFLAGRAMCSSKPILLETSVNNVADYRNHQWTIEEYASSGYTSFWDRARNGTQIFSTTNTAFLQDESYPMSVPLQMVSALASANDYVPIGYLSQNSNIGYRLAITIKNTQFNTTINGTNVNINLASLQHRIFNPRLVCKYITVKNQTLVNELDRMFNKIPMEIGGVTLTPTIKINFNNFIASQAKIVRNGNTGASLRYNLSERSLKGAMIRFNGNTLNASPLTDKNLSDTPVILTSLQISVGSRTIPLQPLRLGYRNGVFRSQEPFYSEARHLFDPNNTYCRTGALSRFYNQRFPYPSGDGGGTAEQYRNQNTYYICFENLGQNAFETEQTDHSRGIDTWVEGNYLSIDMEFSNALTEDMSVETTFVKQSTLLVSNGQVELIENKVAIEPSAPIA